MVTSKFLKYIWFYEIPQRGKPVLAETTSQERALVEGGVMEELEL
jgi:hypothetical protein